MANNRVLSFAISPLMKRIFQGRFEYPADAGRAMRAMLGYLLSMSLPDMKEFLSTCRKAEVKWNDENKEAKEKEGEA